MLPIPIVANFQLVLDIGNTGNTGDIGNIPIAKRGYNSV